MLIYRYCCALRRIVSEQETLTLLFLNGSLRSSLNQKSIRKLTDSDARSQVSRRVGVEASKERERRGGRAAHASSPSVTRPSGSTWRRPLPMRPPVPRHRHVGTSRPPHALPTRVAAPLAHPLPASACPPSRRHFPPTLLVLASPTRTYDTNAAPFDPLRYIRRASASPPSSSESKSDSSQLKQVKSE